MSLLVWDEDAIYKEYAKPGRREGRALTSCTFVIAELGVFGMLTGYFTPVR